ncbi:hypothetical protein [Mycobacterium sp. NPDC006124]|uniref:hypothetical protein n=1 Tax=Mycobacterium sp. NPDC006124 TaxID=3156729 RepID=UPI0033A15070
MIAAGLLLAGATSVVAGRRGNPADAHRNQLLGYAVIPLVGAVVLAVVAVIDARDRFVWVVVVFLVLTGGRQLSRWWAARNSPQR